MLSTSLRKNLLIVLLTAFWAQCCLAASAGDEARVLTIPQDRQLAVILPDAPTPTEVFAAEELARYLSAMRGSNPLLGGGDGDAYPVYVGRTEASAGYTDQLTAPLPETAEEVFVVAVSEEEAVLAGGGDRGTLYAVYAFLEDLGCLWLEPGPEGEYVPESPELVLPVQERVERPVMTIRHIGTSGQLEDPLNKAPEQIEQTIDWMVKNRLNFSFSLRPAVLYRLMPPEKRNLWGIRGGMVKWQHIVHNFPFIFPNEKYFDSNPEYYALYKGRRIPIGPEMGNLALTNPEVRRLAAEYAANWFDQNPDGRVVPMVPPDGAIKWDESPEAMALGGRNFVTGPDGSMTRRMVEFSSAVADLLAEEYPDRYILNLAYANYVEPYPGLTLPSNVIAQVAHGYAGQGSFIHSIYSDRNEEARDIFEAWANSGAGGIGIWDYFILHVPDRAGSPRTPLGLGGVARDMIGYLAELKPEYKVYFTQAGNEHWQYNAFLYWAVAQLAWNPEVPLETLIERWSRAAFGEAWQHAYRYHTALEETYDNDEWTVGIWREINVPSPLIFTNAFINEAHGHLDGLEDSLPEDNTLGRDLAGRMKSSITFAENSVKPQKVFGPGGEWTIERAENHYTINASGPEEADETILQELSEAHGGERTLKHVKFRADKRKEPIIWLENDKLRIGILPGIGGRIIRMIDRSSGENLLYEPEINSLRNPGAPYFRYGGYEEYTGDAFASPGWEIPMRVVEEQATRLTLTGEVDGARIRRTYELGPGGSAQLVVKTTLTNNSDEQRPSRIRVHPEFKLDERLEQTRLITMSEDGDYEVTDLFHSDKASSNPGNTWGAYSTTHQVAVLNDYQPDQIDHPHLHLDPLTQSFNIELLGRPVNLAPGESVELSHRYRVIAGQEANDLFAVHFPTVKDNRQQWMALEEDGQSDDGAGSAGLVYTQGDVPVTLVGVPSEIGLKGRIECEFNLSAAPEAIQDAVLFSFGDKNPDWMIARISEGYLYLYRTRGTSPYNRPGDAWSKLQVDVRELIEPGLWHVLVLEWDGTAGDGQGRMSISLDGQVIDERNDLTIPAVDLADTLMIGGNVRAINNGRFPGSIDQVRVYNEEWLAEDDGEVSPIVLLERRPD